MATEPEIGKAERGNILISRHIIRHAHTRSGCGREVRVILEIDGVVHFVGGIHESQRVVVSHGACDFVGVVGAVHLLARDIQGSGSRPALAVSHLAGDDGGPFRYGHRLAVAVPPFVGIRRSTARCCRGERHRRQLITPDRHVARSGNSQFQVAIVLFFDGELAFEKRDIRTFLGSHFHRISALRQAIHGDLAGSLHSGNIPFHLVIRRFKEGRYFEMDDSVFARVAGLVLVHNNLDTFPRIFFLMDEGQMQRDGARAILVIDVMVHVVAALQVGFPVSRPCVAVAVNRLILLVILPVLDRQVEGFRAGTTIQVGVFENIVAAFRVKFPVGGPNMRFAVPIRLLVMGAMVDIEPQDLRDIASGRSGGDGIVGAALRVGGTASRPSVRLTFRERDFVGFIMGDGQVQGVKTQTTLVVIIVERIVAAGRVGLTGDGPEIAFAGGDVDGVVAALTDRHGERGTVGAVILVSAFHRISGGLVRVDIDGGACATRGPHVGLRTRSRELRRLPIADMAVTANGHFGQLVDRHEYRSGILALVLVSAHHGVGRARGRGDRDAVARASRAPHVAFGPRGSERSAPVLADDGVTRYMHFWQRVDGHGDSGRSRGLAIA